MVLSYSHKRIRDWSLSKIRCVYSINRYAKCEGDTFNTPNKFPCGLSYLIFFKDAYVSLYCRNVTSNTFRRILVRVALTGARCTPCWHIQSNTCTGNPIGIHQVQGIGCKENKVQFRRAGEPKNIPLIVIVPTINAFNVINMHWFVLPFISISKQQGWSHCLHLKYILCLTLQRMRIVLNKFDIILYST